MELTAAGPIILFAGVAIALFVALVLGWPRPGGRARPAVLRGAQALLLNGAVIALCFLLLNDQYVFYSSWSDLFGARSSQVHVHHGATSAELQRARVAGPGLGRVAGVRSFALPQPGARLQRYTVPDPQSGSRTTVLVYLPAGYNPRSPRSYPVIYGLHGFPGGPQSFARHNFFATADQLTVEHKLAPSIFVIPTIDVPAGLDTECIDGPRGEPQTETWLTRDIPAWAIRHLHVRTDRSSWVTMGYSYGAWCAALLTMRHPDLFGGAIIFQGYFRPDFASGYDPFGPAALRRYDLIRLAETAPPPVALWIFTSRQDALSYPTTSRLLSVVRPPLDVSATVLATGGHRNSVFEPFTRNALGWLAQTLPPFHA